MNNPIKSVNIFYAINKSDKKPPEKGEFKRHPEGEWPDLKKGEVMWLKTEVTFSDWTTVECEPSIAYEGA